MLFTSLKTSLLRPACAALLRQPTCTTSIATRQFQRAFMCSATRYPEHSIMILPALSPTMEEGTLVRWALKVGDEIGAGTVLCEIETDKATVDYEAQDEGFLAKQLVEEGTSDLPVGTPIGIIVEDEADIAAFANFTSADVPDDGTSDAAPAEKPAPTPAPTPTPAPVAAPVVAKPTPPAPVQPPPATPAAAPVPPTAARKPVAVAIERESPLSKMLEAQRAAYESKYGSTLTVAQKVEA